MKICQHGRVGSDCRYSHPKMCRKYIKNSYNNNGCTKGAKCKFFHPKLCHNSIDFFNCDKVYCNFYHLVGSHRPNSGNSLKNNDQFMDSQQQGHSDGDNMINNYERFTRHNNNSASGNYHLNAQQPVDDQNDVSASSQQIQNNSAYSGAQPPNQQPVVNNDHTDQRINQAFWVHKTVGPKNDSHGIAIQSVHSNATKILGPTANEVVPPSDEPSGIQPCPTSNMYNFIFMNIAHLLRDSYRDKSKVKFLGDLTDNNTLFVGLTETFLNSNILDSEILMEGVIEMEEQVVMCVYT